ncbi:MAG: SRPBCC family protein [Paracoccaceae bacterium]
MELVGEQKINATRDVVFAALNNTEILAKAIPGCEEIVKVSDTEMTAIVALKVGPVRARFKGSVQLSNLNPPEGYTISGEGKAGPAGSARGGADVVLVEDGENTILKYDVSAKVMGKFAQLGNRLIDSTAKKLAAQFFEEFAAIVVSETNAAEDAIDAEPADAVSSDRGIGKSVVWIIVALVAAAIIAFQVF